MQFELHPKLAEKIVIQDLPLCRVLLQDEAHYPWLFLVPRRPQVSRMMDLSPQDQLQLMSELDLAQKILWNLFKPTQLNVAAIGNVVPQLHIHVIARFAHDPAWPGTAWNHPAHLAYTEAQKQEIVATLKQAFNCEALKT